MDLFIDIIGYLAALCANMSMYPHAYNIRLIVYRGEYHKLQNMSIALNILQTVSCMLWFIYGNVKGLYPIMISCTINTIPNTYIVYMLVRYRVCRDNIIDNGVDKGIDTDIDIEVNENQIISCQDDVINDGTQVITASSSSPHISSL